MSDATSNAIQSTKRYHDLLFRIVVSLIAAHFIISFGIEETFFQLLLSVDYYKSLAGSAMIAFILITSVRAVTIKLDQRYDWRYNSLSRTLLQVLFGIVIIAIIAFLLATIYFAIYGINILRTVYLKYDFPVIVVFILVLNLYYFCYYLLQQLAPASKVQPQAELSDTKYLTVFVVSKGAENLPVDVADIAAIYHEGKYNFIRLFNTESFLISQSLDQIEQQLHPDRFFRINRTTIINRSACKSFITLDYGRLDVVTDPVMKGELIVSQKRSSAFKKWLEQKS